MINIVSSSGIEIPLNQLLSYDKDSGVLTWLPRDVSLFKNVGKAKSWNSAFAGKEAFRSSAGKGYLAGSIFDHRYLAHRVVWA